MEGVDHIPLVVYEYGEDKWREVNWKEIDWERDGGSRSYSIGSV